MHPGSPPPEQPGPSPSHPGQTPSGWPSPPTYPDPQPGGYPPQTPPYNYPPAYGYPQQTAGYGYPPQAPQHGYGSGPYPPHSGSGGGKKAALITLIVVMTLGLLTAGGFGAYALFSDDESVESSGSSAGTEYGKLGDPDALSDTDLNKVDKQKLFSETVRNMMLQTKVRTKSETAMSTTKNLSGGFGYRKDVGFDYQTKALSLDKDSDLSDTRCVDGKAYRFGFDETWKESTSGGCELKRTLYDIGDTLNLFGFTESQADAAMAYFTEDFPDFIDVTDLTLSSGLGKEKKKYLRFVVDYTPIPSGQYGYIGLQHFVWAFQRTETKYDQHPYSPKGSGGQGLHVVYYVDTKTGLPVYSQQSNIPPFDDKGKPYSLEEKGTGYREDRYEYYFGEEPATLDMGTNTSITLDWKRDDDAEWKPPSK